MVGGTLRDTSAGKDDQRNADNFNTRKNVALGILSHDPSGAFIMAQQIAQFLQKEVTPPGSRVPEMLRVLTTTGRNAVKMIWDLINIECPVARCLPNLKPRFVSTTPAIPTLTPASLQVGGAIRCRQAAGL